METHQGSLKEEKKLHVQMSSAATVSVCLSLLDDITDVMDMSLSKLQELVMDREA